jgi:hypothetical protein
MQVQTDIGDNDTIEAIAEQLTVLLDRLKKLSPSAEVPPHRPDDFDNMLRARIGMGFRAPVLHDHEPVDHSGLEQARAAERERREREAAAAAESAREAERAQRQQDYELRTAALAGDLSAIRGELGDAEFMRMTAQCVGGALIAFGISGPASAIQYMLINPDCRLAVIESYKRTVAAARAILNERQRREARERFERMDRTNYEMEQYERWSATA